MTPTNKLRFLECWVDAPLFGCPNGTYKEKRLVLQQWWEDKNIMLTVHITDQDGNPVPSPTRGEWRDVPTEKEA